MPLVWKPFHNTASITARADGRGYYIHRVGGLFEVVVVTVGAEKLGRFAYLAHAKARADEDLAAERRIVELREKYGPRTPASAASTRRVPGRHLKAHE